MAVNFCCEFSAGSKQNKYPKVFEKGWIQPGNMWTNTTIPPNMKIHGGSTAFNTAPNGAVPQRSFMMDANMRSMTPMTMATKIPSMVRLRTPMNNFRSKTMKVVQKNAAKQTVMDVSAAI